MKDFIEMYSTISQNCHMNSGNLQMYLCLVIGGDEITRPNIHKTSVLKIITLGSNMCTNKFVTIGVCDDLMIFSEKKFKFSITK